MTTKTWQLIHMVGIAGAGMCGIAKVLSEQGIKVSGSDLQCNDTTEKLKELGIKTYKGHDSSNVKQEVDMLVISTAIPHDNPEVKKAVDRNIPVLKRGEMLANIVNQYKGIAVAGAHGKTTTTSMMSMVCSEAKIDPSFIIGGEIQGSNVNARLGEGDYFIVEADESDASFLDLNPHIAIVTNIEDDHLDYYKSFDKLLDAFKQFLDRVNPNGFALLFGDDPHLNYLKDKITPQTIIYGENEDYDYYLKNWRIVGPGSKFEVFNKKTYLGTLQLSIPGKHNALNALAVTAVANELGISFEHIQSALIKFKGAKRRFEIIGVAQNITIVDDYAHHPTEIAVTIKAAKEFHNGRVVVVFQPHRYSRTNLLGEELGEAFFNADLAIISDVYSAGEEPIPDVNGEVVWRSAVKAGYNALYIPKVNDIETYLLKYLQPNDLVITMGAGDIWGLGIKLLEKLEGLSVLRS
ncbi:UDP-N-acetylmuramate--L-alanine ligase [Candidatus Syntrophocurvum alkaliphilum]|uniref:UDP-N-acetylmuramate--L-alanine ligase n=1 Tax=Candidatus Syntrophocurvum alkaliphilum TaxID=2293317 RepID=A0A6I6D9K8_9FIRM|nr:UDP-N-acetylmuramate--L-alanine ligase [Candidatus Syntrophocurvum alkaliphilum]QGT99137.1 UDP-N-acetylmuramate--L-alanine ligase [Candidatus Syntrophocurvum alkaliphilum]